MTHSDRPQTADPADYLAETVRQIVASLTAQEVAAIRFITPRAPERKPKNISQGVCLSRLSRHGLADGLFAELTQETQITGSWSPFRLTPLGIIVRNALEAAHVTSA